MLGPRILMFGCWRYWGYYVMFCFHVMSFKGGKVPPPKKKSVSWLQIHFKKCLVF